MKRLPEHLIQPKPGRRSRPPVFTSSHRFSLEPVHEANLRQFCEKHGLSVAEAVRYAVASMLENYMTSDFTVDRYFESYGKLSKNQLSVRMSPVMTHRMLQMSTYFGFGRERAISAVLRAAVSRSFSPPYHAPGATPPTQVTISSTASSDAG